MSHPPESPLSLHDLLGYYGRITAHISHEIKNVAAVINENNGLLQDLLDMAARGRELDVERIARLAQSNREQVRRFEEVVGGLNRFAHLTDKPLMTFDVRQAVELARALNKRAAAGKGATLVVEEGGENISVTASGFLLQRLLTDCLEAAYGHLESGTLRLACAPAEGGATVTISGLSSAAGAMIFPDPEAASVAQAMGAGISIDIERGAMVIDLPRTMKEQTRPTP